MFKQLTIGLVITFLTGISASVSAAIIDTSNNVSIISPPESLDIGYLSSDSNVFLFNEKKDYLLKSDVFINTAQSGEYTNPGTNTPSNEYISAGTSVDSYYLHYDPTSSSGSISGSLTFNTEVIGLIFLNNELISSLPIFGSPSTIYLNDQIESIESPAIGDLITLSPDRLSLLFEFSATSRTDNIRIITSTSPVPVPPSILLFLSGLIGLTIFSKRKV